MATSTGNTKSKPCDALEIVVDYNGTLFNPKAVVIHDTKPSPAAPDSAAIAHLTVKTSVAGVRAMEARRRADAGGHRPGHVGRPGRRAGTPHRTRPTGGH